MDVRVKATGYTLKDETSRYLEKRLASLEKLVGADAEITRCEVEIRKDAGKKQHSDHMWCAEIHMVLPGKKSIYAKNRAASVNAAIDDVKEEIERQLRKTKKIERTVVRKGGAVAKRRMRFGR